MNGEKSKGHFYCHLAFLHEAKRHNQKDTATKCGCFSANWQDGRI